MKVTISWKEKSEEGSNWAGGKIADKALDRGGFLAIVAHQAVRAGINR